MGAPKIAIVGRTNVGKSSLFNWLAGRRIAIVDPTAVVTRDRVTHLTPINDRDIEVIDTGGMGVKDEDNLTDDIEKQIAIAIESASIVLFVVDVRDGITPLDEVEKLFDIHFPEDADYDTIGGFIIDQLGRLPEEGERPCFPWDGVSFTVIAMDERRIDQVYAERLPVPEESEETSAD